VSTDVIRAWERRYGLLNPVRSDANFRLYTAADIARLRLMRHYTEQNIPRARAAELVRDAFSAALDRNPGIPEPDVRRALAVLENSLERFDAGPAERLLQRLSELFTAGAILRDVILPYLRELGARWECAQASVAQEHYASCFLEGWMLGTVGDWMRPGGRRAVLACVPGEHHALGLTAFGLALRDLGWSITFLGRDTPLDSARYAADAVGAEVIVLAAALPDALDAAVDDIAALVRTHPVVVGGPATAQRLLPRLGPRVLPADLLAAAQVLAMQKETLAPAVA
jgi:MerR family transcriptional regulator, light-induced transcriptional regulator